MNTSFRLFPDSTAASGAKPGGPPPSPRLAPEALAVQALLRGIHF
jgi:hypothetical protein